MENKFCQKKCLKSCVNFVRTIIFISNVWKDLRVTTNFFSFKQKYNFISFFKSFVPDFDNRHYLLTLNDSSNESTLVCDSYKTLGNDLNLSNEIYGKNDRYTRTFKRGR